MKTIRKNASLRYLEFIKDLRNQIELNKEISINDLTSKHKIATGQLKNLNELKIIKKISPKKYKWIGAVPTLKMANKILEFQKNIVRNIKPCLINEVLQTKIDFKKPDPDKSSITKIKEIKVEKQNYTLSILWGLIKIQKS